MVWNVKGVRVIEREKLKQSHVGLWGHKTDPWSFLGFVLD